MPRPSNFALVLFLTSLLATTGTSDKTDAEPAGAEAPDVAREPASSSVTLSSIAQNLDTTDPSTVVTVIRQADLSRVGLADFVVRASSEDEATSRAALACQNLAYNNGPPFGGAPVFSTFGGDPSTNNAFDDCTLPPASANRFICAAQVRTFGARRFGGAETYDLKVQVWGDCPENTGAVLIAEGVFVGIPNDERERIHTITIDPPYFDGGTVWVGVSSDNVDASWLVAGNTSDPGDVGSTANLFARNDGQAGCNLFSYGNGRYAGFPITLLGSTGALGSCCDLNSAACTDGVAQQGCLGAPPQAWSALACSQRTDCVVCNVPACAIGGAGNLENEPDCSTNYVDTRNRGCQNLTSGADTSLWTPVACGQTGCGRSGTYTFLNSFTLGGVAMSVLENRRDDDHYLLSLTQDTQVTWKVSGRFPAEAVISFTLRQTNGNGALHCPAYVSTVPGDVSVASAPACGQAVATACLPGRGGAEGPYRYFLRARPGVARLGDNALCGLPYTFDLSCQPCSLSTGACCTDQGCIITSRLSCLILTGSDTIFYHGDGSSCATANCVGVPGNDTCLNKGAALTCESCVIPFDTTFAHSSDTATGTLAGGNVFKDIWYGYTVQQPASGHCLSGRIVISTIGACFNSKVQLFRTPNCNATQAVQCNTTSLNTSNLAAGGTFVPIKLLVGPPVVNVAPFAYGRSGSLVVIGANPGACWKIRVGGLTEDDFGAGLLRIDFKCETPINPATDSWDSASGRCCIWNAGNHSMSCQIAPLTDFSAAKLPQCCARLGGFLRNQTDFYDGATNPAAVQPVVEIPAAGCASLPCPAEGEACFNAWNVTDLLGNGFGTITRMIKNKLYFKYIVPANATVGSGLAIDTSGCDFDTALAVYRGFNLQSGECDGTSGTNSRCGNIAGAYNSSEVVRAEDCGERTTCTCLKIVAAGQTPQAGEVAQGDAIWIGIGLKNTLPGGTRPFIDPIRADDCALPKLASLAISNPAACFSCAESCPPGATPENESLPTPNCNDYVDTTNAGCTAANVSNVNFTPISCGQTYCGTSATYRNSRGPCNQTVPPCLSPEVCLNNLCYSPTDDARDVDIYRIQITTPQRLVWTLSSAFPATVQIIASPSNNCADQTVIASSVGLTPCTTLSVQADACPGWYYLLVEPTLLGNVPCGSIYYATLTCTPPAAPACCKGDANNDGQVDGADIRAWLNQLSSPVGQPETLLDPVVGCFNVRTCAADFTGDLAVDIADLPGFVAALLAGDACVSTQCEEAPACHIPADADVGVVSDLSTSTFGGGFRCADDFKVTQGEALAKLCWWGFYFDFNDGLYCSPAAGDSPDSFLVTIYADAGGVPGSVIGGPVAPINLIKTDTGIDLNYVSRAVRRFKYQADLPSPIAVTPGGCYWIEIANHTTGSCLWLWETSVNGGNGLCAEKSGGLAGAMDWHSFDLAAEDVAFCLPGLRIDAADCGLPLGRCCVYPPGSPFGQCSLQIQAVCERTLGGRWTLNSDCSGPCPVIQTSGGCPGSPMQSHGPDVVVADITGPMNFSSAGNVEALTFGADACNVGDQPVIWLACPNNTHPVFGGNLYKWQTVGGATRFEQVGQSWLKNGFGADQAPTCCTNCIPYPDQTHLGLGCSDAYVASQMAQQSNLSPKYIVNAHTGFYPTGCTAHPSGTNAGYLQVDTADLVATGGGSGATVRYFCQFQYLTADDAASHNQNNNASSREVAVSGGGTAWDFSFPPGSATQFEIPAIRLWQTIDSGVVETDINTPEDDGFPGLVILAAKATDLGTGFWRYEYAVNNLNSDRSIGSFSVPCSASATVQNIGFHDVAYRDGDGVGGVNFDGTDWPSAFAGGAVSWATTPFATNNNANAIRWGTSYNFRFDANRPPAPGGGNVTLGEFKVVTNVTASTVVPTAP